MVKAAASSWLALGLSSDWFEDFWVRPVAALTSRNTKSRYTRIGARPFFGRSWAAESGGGEEILCQIGERGARVFLQGKFWTEGSLGRFLPGLQPRYSMNGTAPRVILPNRIKQLKILSYMQFNYEIPADDFVAAQIALHTARNKRRLIKRAL